MLNDLLSKTVKLTTEKKCLAAEILQLTSAQAGLLEPGQVQELLLVINQKQRCIDNMTIIESELRQMEQEVRQVAELSSNKDWRQIEDLRSDIQVLLKEAQSKDESNRQIISQEFGKLKKVMQALRARRGTLKAYQGTAAQSEGYFIDHKK